MPKATIIVVMNKYALHYLPLSEDLNEGKRSQILPAVSSKKKPDFLEKIGLIWFAIILKIELK
jgi:hypothetical protein